MLKRRKDEFAAPSFQEAVALILENRSDVVEIDLTHIDLTQPMVEELADAIRKNTYLVSININYSNLKKQRRRGPIPLESSLGNTDRRFPLLLEELKPLKENSPSVTEMCVSNRGLITEDIRQLVAALEHNTFMKSLRICHNKIDDEGALLLAELKLRCLSIYGNFIGERGTFALVQSITIEVLVISKLHSDEVIAALNKNTILRSLDVSSCEDELLQKLSNSRLVALNMGRQVQRTTIENVLTKNTSLRKLVLDTPDISDATAPYVAQLCANLLEFKFYGLIHHMSEVGIITISRIPNLRRFKLPPVFPGNQELMLQDMQTNNNLIFSYLRKRYGDNIEQINANKQLLITKRYQLVQIILAWALERTRSDSKSCIKDFPKELMIHIFTLIDYLEYGKTQEEGTSFATFLIENSQEFKRRIKARENTKIQRQCYRVDRMQVIPYFSFFRPPLDPEWRDQPCCETIPVLQRNAGAPLNATHVPSILQLCV